MENVITEVSKYLIILLMMIYTFSCFTVFRKRDIEDQKNVLRRQIVLMLFMNLVAYTVLFLQDNDMKMLMMYGAVFLFIVVVQILYRVIYRKGNMLIVNNMCMLLSIGFLILSRLSFGKAVKQFEIVVIGMVLSFIVPVIVRKVKILKDLTWLYGIVGLALLMVVLAMAAISGGAKLSIEIGGVTFQFSELVKITFVFFVAGMLREDTGFKMGCEHNCGSSESRADSGCVKRPGKCGRFLCGIYCHVVCGNKESTVCSWQVLPAALCLRLWRIFCLIMYGSV